MQWRLASVGDALGFAQHLRNRALGYGAEKTAQELEHFFANRTGDTGENLRRLRDVLVAVSDEVKARFPADDGQEVASVLGELERLVDRLDHARR